MTSVSRTTAARLRGRSDVCAAAVLAVALAGCSSSAFDSRLGVSSSPRVVQPGQPVPSGGGHYKVGKPYQIAGRWFHPKDDPSYDRVGMASWYGEDFHGRKTANGEVYDMNGLSAAHPTLPMPTYARVTNLENGRSVVVRINDRGPFAHNRVIDLSHRTAKVLDFKHQGTAQVRVQYVGPAPLEGDDSWLTTTARHDGAPLDGSMIAGTPQQTPATGPATASYGPAPVTTAPGPVPQVPAGGPQPAYVWVPGFAPAETGEGRVASVFALFDL